MGKYKNKFKVGDYVVCNANYSWIRRGTTYQVKAVNRTGSIQLHGSAGNYNPDKFYLASEDAPTKLIIKGFSVGDRVTWAQGNSSYEIVEFSNDRKRARMKPGSGLFINKYNSVNTSEQADAHDGDWIDIKHLQVVDSFEEYYTTDHENTKEQLYIAICVDGRYPDINTFIADCKKNSVPVTLTNSTKFMQLFDKYNKNDIIVIQERPLINPTRFTSTVSAARCREAELIMLEIMGFITQAGSTGERYSVGTMQGVNVS